MSNRVDSLASGQLVAYSLDHLVGRVKEKESTCQAIQDGVRIVYIEGGGGIGKTRLLSEVKYFVKDLSCCPVVLSIVDFYDTAMHGSLALEEALANRIQEQPGEFDVLGPFFEVLEQYRAGHSTEDEVHAAFTQAFNTWVGERWAILCFDTAESLEYGRGARKVLEECKVGEENAPAVKWLQERLPALKRVTALIAGRPTRTIREQLENAHSGDSWWKHLSLATLSLGEAYQYFQVSEYGREIDEETVERIWLLTNGRPILLSLAIDWLFHGVRLDEIYEAEIQELHHLKEQGGDVWEKRRQRFEKALVGKFRLLNTPMDAAVYYAARARKGFTVEMLHRMLKELSPGRIDLTPQEDNELLENLSRLSFVKHPYGARDGWFFLHDEMYDLVDRHVWQPDYPGYTHQVETARFLAEQIYGKKDGERLIAEATEQLGAAKKHIDLIKARRYLDILLTEQLFYWLEMDPAGGYQRYERLDTQAASQKNREWSDMLRIEILRFMHTLTDRARWGGLVKGIDPESGELILADFVNQDARARWIHRFLAHGDYDRVESVARHLMDLHLSWGGFWKARVMIGQGAALVRMGQPEAVGVLREAIDILEQLDLDKEDPWMVRHYIAMAHLYLGLQARAGWDLGQITESYNEAHKLFDENDEPIEAARASNNLAYILVKQGEYKEAVGKAQDAVNMREQLGDVVGKGLSLNTLAIAVDRGGNPTRARRHALDALRQLQRAKEEGYPGLSREIAMIHINLGRIQRHKARGEQPQEVQMIEGYWQDAEKHLRRAMELEAHLEPYYRFDLYNQLGLLYSNWANWIAIREPEKRVEYHGLMEQGSEYFRLADQFAEGNNLFVDQADNLEDWAWVFHLRWAYREKMKDEEKTDVLRQGVFDRLDRAEELALESIGGAAEQKGLQAYYILGSTHHQRGRFIHKFENNLSKALKEYALSVAYYDQFALNPLDPLERKERTLQHIESALEDMLKSSSLGQVKQVLDEVLKIVEDKELPSTDLRNWLDDLLA